MWKKNQIILASEEGVEHLGYLQIDVFSYTMFLYTFTVNFEMRKYWKPTVIKQHIKIVIVVVTFYCLLSD